MKYGFTITHNIDFMCVACHVTPVKMGWKTVAPWTPSTKLLGKIPHPQLIGLKVTRVINWPGSGELRGSTAKGKEIQPLCDRAEKVNTKSDVTRYFAQEGIHFADAAVVGFIARGLLGTE